MTPGRLTPLRIALLRSGMSQKQLAKRIGKHESVVSRIFNGLRCDAETQQGIARVLEVSVSELWPNHDAPVDHEPLVSDPADRSAA